MNPSEDLTAPGPMSDADFRAEMQAMIDQAPKTAVARTPKEAAKPPGAGAVFVEDTDRQDAVTYTHEGMIELIIRNPTWSHAKLAKHFGYTPGWFANVLAGDDFQRALDPRRHEVADPTMTATLEERFRGLTLQALGVMQKLLDNPKVQDATVLKAAEIGIKALGLGAKKDADEDDKPKGVQSLDILAERLTGLMKNKGATGLIPERQAMIDLNPAVRKSGASDDLLQELKEVQA